MTNSWLYYDHPPQPGDINMAIDEYFLSQNAPILRLYEWHPSCLSIGRNQPLDEINQTFCKQQNISIVRRITGGQAVLHDQELTYSVIAPKQLFAKSIIQSYTQITNALLQAFQSINIPVHYPKTTTNIDQKSPICFNTPQSFELCIDNKKLVGSAQRRIKNKILQHGSIPFNCDFDTLANCLNSPNAKANFITINQISSPPSRDTLKCAIKTAFEQTFDTQLINTELSKTDWLIIKNISKKY